MPSKTCHLAVAGRNQRTIDFLVSEIQEHSEWISTIAFYKALHLVEAAFSQDASIRHGRTHENRERQLKSNRKYSHIWKFYRLLWAASTVARYLEDKDQDYSSFSDYLSPTDVQDKVLKHWLAQVENSVKNLLQ